jgi:DNA-binding GntR family transcriptional regulator
MDFDLEVKLAVYRHFAASGARPSATQIAGGLDVPDAAVREAFGRLRTQRVLVLDPESDLFG